MTNRRNFVNWLGASGFYAAVGAPSLVAPGVHVPAGAAMPITDKWDMSWVDRVKGKHRAVFDSPEVSGGAAVFRAVVWCDQHKEVYGTPRSEMSPVLVLRHNGIVLATNDAYWDRFEVGKAEKIKDPVTKKWFRRNPVRATDPGTPPEYAGYSIEGFVASGGIVLACNLAFGDIVATVQKADKLSDEAARAKAKEMLLPGVILQPSGVFAVLRAQEAGCDLMMAS